jgi:hypothetical protein
MARSESINDEYIKSEQLKRGHLTILRSFFNENKKQLTPEQLRNGVHSLALQKNMPVRSIVLEHDEDTPVLRINTNHTSYLWNL